jgi:hypothetical protein
MPTAFVVRVHVAAGSYGTFRWRGRVPDTTHCELYVIGTETKVTGVAISNVTAVNRATGQPWAIDATTLPASWTASGYVNKFIIINAGARAGAWAAIAKDLAGANKTARTTPFAQVSANGTLTGFATPQIGDTFDIVTAETSFTGFQISDDLGALVNTVFTGCTFAIVIYTKAAGYATFNRCALVDSFLPLGSYALNLNGCTITTTYVPPGGSVGYITFIGCLITGLIQKPLSGLPGVGGMPTLYFDKDCVFQGGQIAVADNQVFVGDVGVFDVTGDFIQIDRGRVDPAGSGGKTLYGSGVTGVGVKIDKGGSFRYSTLPTLSTVGANANIQGVTKTWAQLPFRDLTSADSGVTITGTGAYAGPA